MPLTAGEKLGPYEILAPIGSGGMGEVYRALDTRLGRDVAIKVSAEHFSERMEREARTIAALNHPHIATLYGVGEHEGSLYLAMEFVKGAPLKGPCPVKEAISYGIQIAEGLAAAHEAGVVHRDLKPGNILLTEKGSVKILDFGLAKLTEQGRDRANASTQTLAIAGTPGYLAPEQLHGKPADARSDIFAFGCILYELVSGQRAFPGETMAASLASTAMMEPKPLEGVPAALEELIGRCLRKDPERRLQHIADARVMLEDVRDRAQPGSARRQEPVAASARPALFWLGWIAAALFFLAAASLALVHFREKPAELRLVRVSIPAPENTAFASDALISPDGQRIVFAASPADGKSQLWVRALDNLAAQPLRAIGFVADGKLKSIDAAGGPSHTLAEVPEARGASWSREDVIVFSPGVNAPLVRVAAAGGATTPVTKLDAASRENTHRAPWFLPDGRHFLFSAGVATVDRKAVRIGSLDSLESKVLLEADSNAIYAQGYLLFLRGSTLMAQPFDAKRLALTGEAMPLAEQVQRGTSTSDGFFSASQTGLLAYRAGAESGGMRLTWTDRSGKRLATVGDPSSLGRIQLSPDGKKAAVAVTEGNNTDIWIYDLARNLRTRFTFDPAVEQEAVWSPDGRTIVFSSNRKGRLDLYRKASDGGGAEELVYSDGLDQHPSSWSPDGKFLLYDSQGIGALEPGPPRQAAIWVLPLAAGAKPFPLVQTPFSNSNAQFSPDGQRVAYQSTESGRFEIYVVPFRPHGGSPGGKDPVSAAGGVQARWRSDGKELFFVRGRELMAAEVGAKSATFETGQVSALFGPLVTGRGLLYDAAAGGQRFLAVVPPEQETSAPLTVVQNWTAGLKK